MVGCAHGVSVGAFPDPIRSGSLLDEMVALASDASVQWPRRPARYFAVLRPEGRVVSRETNSLNIGKNAFNKK